MRNKLFVSACMAACLMFGAVAYAQDATPEATAGPLTLGDVTGGNAANYYGQSVTLDGNVDEMVNVRSFLLGGGGLNNPQVLVLNNSGQEFNIGLTKDAKIRVTGTIYPSYNQGGWDQVSTIAITGGPMASGMDTMTGANTAAVDTMMSGMDTTGMDSIMATEGVGGMDTTAMMGTEAAMSGTDSLMATEGAMDAMAGASSMMATDDVMDTASTGMDSLMATEAATDTMMSGMGTTGMDTTMMTATPMAGMDTTMSGMDTTMSTSWVGLDQYPLSILTNRFPDHTILVIDSIDAVEFLPNPSADVTATPAVGG